MNILYIACSCAPYSGSEDKIGWSIPMYSAKKHRVFVLTFERQREYIEAYLKKNPTDNPKFYYVDIPEIWKSIFRGPFFSGRMNIWHRRAIKIAEEICRQEKIDIIHQITPVEFRSIGPYGRIPGVKFVCGPIAGGEDTPKGLKDYLKKNNYVEIARAAANLWYRAKHKVTGMIEQCDYLLIANHETEAYLQKILPAQEQRSILTDVSIDKTGLCKPETLAGKSVEDVCRFLSVGRLVYRKGYAFLLDALAGIPKEKKFICQIVGTGPELPALQKRCEEYNLTDCVYFRGAVPHSEIADVYRESDVFVMPSLREATGTVVLEAMGQGVPVITVNRFGGADIIDADSGWLYEGETREDYVRSLRALMMECIENSEEVLHKGRNARMRAEQYTWDIRLAAYEEIYKKVLKQDNAM